MAASVLLACLGGCSSSTPSAKQTPREDFVIIASSDTRGWIEPCGCASGQSGGLSRRATLAEKLIDGRPALLVSAGGAGSGTRPYDVEKLRAIINGENAMGYEVHNIGVEELKIGIDRVGGETDVTFVTTNTVHPDNNSAERSVILNKGGWRVIVLGVLQPDLAPGYLVDDPQTEILSELEANRGAYDVAIVLACMEGDELRSLAETLPEVDVVIGGRTGQSIAPKRFGQTLLTAVANKGKFIARVNAKSMDSTKIDWSADLHEVSDELAENTVQLDNLKAFRERLSEYDFSADETSFRAETLGEDNDGSTFAGTKSCQECHQEDHQLWIESAHALAWKTLQNAGADVDSSCQRCHSTGYGLPGGFLSRSETMDRIDVGCESCHGPSSRHVSDPKETTPWQAADSCLICHDHENSPEFNYEDYWQQIEHGREATAVQASNRPDGDPPNKVDDSESAPSEPGSAETEAQPPANPPETLEVDSVAQASTEEAGLSVDENDVEPDSTEVETGKPVPAKNTDQDSSDQSVPQERRERGAIR